MDLSNPKSEVTFYKKASLPYGPAPGLSESLLGLPPGTRLLLGTAFYLLVCCLLPGGCCALLIFVPITQLCAQQ